MEGREQEEKREKRETKEGKERRVVQMEIFPFVFIFMLLFFLNFVSNREETSFLRAACMNLGMVFTAGMLSTQERAHQPLCWGPRKETRKMGGGGQWS